jgi:hypothetical protein
MNTLRKTAAVGLALLAFPAAAQAGERIAAVTADGSLVTFDSANPAAVTTVAIAGIGSGQTIRGIDYRPATEQVFLITAPTGAPSAQVAGTYVLDTDTAIARPIGSSATVPGFGDATTGFDFNPNVDRIRVTTATDENFRLNPNNGAVAGDDANLSPDSSDILEVAYDRNTHTAGSVATTLFAINRATSSLARIGGVNGTPSPNGGAITDIGALGVTPDPGKSAGFDISVTGIGHAALTVGGVTRYHVIDLVSGSAGTGVPIGDGTTEVVGLTRVPDSQRLLDSELAQDSYVRGPGKTLKVTVASNLPGDATVTITRGGTTVRTRSAAIGAGRSVVALGKLPARRGSYTITLTVSNGGQVATDTSRLRITR